MNETFSNILLAAAIVLFFYIVSYVINFILRKIGSHHKANASEIFRLLSNSQRALLLSIGVILAIDKLGYDISALVAGLGLTGFAVGFALKDAISNLVAGIMIVIYTPFEIGDRIQISSNTGKVIDINLRYIALETETGTSLVPNSLFLTGVLNLLEKADQSSS